MKLIFDGVTYIVDDETILNIMAGDVRKYLTPDAPEAEKHATERLAAKAALRPFLAKIYAPIAKILGVQDWRLIKPTKQDDLLLHIFEHVLQAFAVILSTATVETEVETQNHDNENGTENSAYPVIRFTRAIFTKPEFGDGDGRRNITDSEWNITTKST